MKSTVSWKIHQCLLFEHFHMEHKVIQQVSPLFWFVDVRGMASIFHWELLFIGQVTQVIEGRQTQALVLWSIDDHGWGLKQNENAICSQGTHYGREAWGRVKCEVCQTLLHMTGSWNRTPDLLILSPMSYLLCCMLSVGISIFRGSYRSSDTFVFWSRNNHCWSQKWLQQ